MNTIHIKPTDTFDRAFQRLEDIRALQEQAKRKLQELELSMVNSYLVDGDGASGAVAFTADVLQRFRILYRILVDPRFADRPWSAEPTMTHRKYASKKYNASFDTTGFVCELPAAGPAEQPPTTMARFDRVVAGALIRFLAPRLLPKLEHIHDWKRDPQLSPWEREDWKGNGDETTE